MTQSITWVLIQNMIDKHEQALDLVARHLSQVPDEDKRNIAYKLGNARYNWRRTKHLCKDIPKGQDSKAQLLATTYSWFLQELLDDLTLGSAPIVEVLEDILDWIERMPTAFYLNFKDSRKADLVEHPGVL